MWEYRNEKCRHRSDIANADTIKQIVEKEAGSYIGLKTHSLGSKKGFDFPDRMIISFIQK